MSHQIEEQVAALGRRIDRIERRLGPEGEGEARVLSFATSVRLLGWIVASGSLLLFLISWSVDASPAWALAAPTLLGLWISLREHPMFDVSDSTLALIQEERASKAPHAALAHKARQAAAGDALSPEHILNSLGVGLGVLILALLAGWAVVYFVPTLSGQVLILAALLLGLLTYSLYANIGRVSLLVAAGLYLLLALSNSPMLGLFLMAALSAWLGTLAFRRRDWNLFLVALLGTYVILGRWALDPAALTAARAAVSVVTAEMLLLATVTFVLPLASLRRTAGERLHIRWLIGLNAFSYTFLAIPLTRALLPNDWASCVSFLLLTGLALAGLSWQAHGRFSYAKYFVLASAAGFLIASILFLDSALVTLVWLMASIILATLGFAAQSYTFRLAGLFALLATVIRYLGVTLLAAGTASPVLFLRDRVWIGLLLAFFLIIVGMWYRDLRSRGSEEKYRVGMAAILYSLSALVICGLVAVEATGLYQ